MSEATRSGATDTRWTVTISCPRPKSRALDDFHTRPDRVAQTTAVFFAGDAKLALTARTVKLRYSGSNPPGDIANLHERLATLLDCLHLTTRGDDGHYRLPRPVRTEMVCEGDS